LNELRACAHERNCTLRGGPEKRKRGRGQELRTRRPRAEIETSKNRDRDCQEQKSRPPGAQNGNDSRPDLGSEAQR
jgi:hypothetical protein